MWAKVKNGQVTETYRRPKDLWSDNGNRIPLSVHWQWSEQELKDKASVYAVKFGPKQEKPYGRMSYTDAYDANTDQVVRTFSYQNLPVAQVREMKMEDLSEVFAAKFAEGYLHSDGNRYDIDPSASANVNGRATVILAGSDTVPILWRDYDNVVRSFDTTAAFLTFAEELADYVSSLYAAKWTHEAGIAAASTFTQAKNYDVTTGWPAN